LAQYLHGNYRLSISSSCRLCSISQSNFYYKAKKSVADENIKIQLLALAKEHRTWGFEKMYAYLKNDGLKFNHKRVHRIYRELSLNKRVKRKKHFIKREPLVLLQPLEPNYYWSIDFMSDALMNGSKIRTFNVIDDFNREALDIKAAFSIPARKVTSVLDSIAIIRGYPANIRVDNGPEFISAHFKNWAKSKGIDIHYIQPGKPAQNAFIERFNKTFREDVIDAYMFVDLEQLQEITNEWIKGYNADRPHQSLGNLSPIDFANKRRGLINYTTVN